MHIRLIYPKMHDTSRGTKVKYRLVPPLSLLSLAAATPPGHRVEIHDENVGPVPFDDGPDLVGITVYVSSARRAYEIADAYRDRGILVVMGGLHASSLPDEAALHADAVVVGEGELVWKQLIADAEARRLEPRYHGGPIPLDAAPLPDRRSIPDGVYLTKNSLLASRGCNRRCDFCYRTAQPNAPLRTRDVEGVAREVDALGGRHLVLLDDNLAADRSYARSLFASLRGRDLVWMGAASLDVAGDEELLDAMAASGCASLFIGIESINQASLDAVGKGSNRVDRYEEHIRKIRARGIMINGSFVFGFDADDGGVFDRTVDWAQAMRIDTATFHILTPYPGTNLFKRLDAEGRIIDRAWDHYDTAHVVFQPLRMSPEELRAGYERAYDRFYSWTAILRRVAGDTWGRLPRLLLNVGYKRMNPLWPFLGRHRLGSIPFAAFVAAARRARLARHPAPVVGAEPNPAEVIA